MKTIFTLSLLCLSLSSFAYTCKTGDNRCVGLEADYVDGQMCEAGNNDMKICIATKVKQDEAECACVSIGEGQMFSEAE